MSEGKIFIISGPSGSGKTTLHKKLLDSAVLKKQLIKSISATTRLPRAGERKGREYLFLSQDEFSKKITQGFFLEWQHVFGNYYGTPKKSVLNLLKKGNNVLLCIDVKGAAAILDQFPKAVRIFIKTPSMAVLKKRLMLRASESTEALSIRLATAKEELKEAKNYHYVVVNDRLDSALKVLENIIVQELNLANS